ncbi:MAG: hypothetical protein LBQ02_01305 [Candidatus Nomurabacteria bacterium]|jgi:hypothetical protein|nr:hypothetical protein [Candidatus Nomurabacteria bacterium]
MATGATTSPDKSSKSKKFLLLFVLLFVVVVVASALVAFFIANGWFDDPETPSADVATPDEADDTSEAANNVEGWAVKTGSWVQTTAGGNPVDADWEKSREVSLDNVDTVYFTHSAAIAATSGNTGYPNSDVASEVKSNIKVNFTLDVTHADSGGTSFQESISKAKLLEWFGDTANCVSTAEQADTDWWTGEGWKIAGTTFPDLNTFKKDDSVHYGLKQTPDSENNNYLCKITFDDAAKDKIRAFGKEITLTSTIAITPSGVELQDGNKVADPKPATTSASITVNPSPYYWRVSVKSFAMVKKTGGGEAEMDCMNGVYCDGGAGISNSNDIFRYPPDHALTVSPAAPPSGEAGCPTDQTKCVEFEFNFKHTVTVADKNTGEDPGKKQLWLYRIVNSSYPNQNGLYKAGGCLGLLNNGSIAGAKNTSEQWYPAVLEAGQTYDIVTGVANENTPLCIAQTAMKNDPTKRGAWQSRLYLCFVSSAGYKYGYGDTETDLATDLETAKTVCDEHIQSANADRTWDTAGSDEVLATSNAVVIYTTAVKKK